MRLFKKKKSHKNDKDKQSPAQENREENQLGGGCCFLFYRRLKDYYSPGHYYFSNFLYDLRESMKGCKSTVDVVVLATAINAAEDFARRVQTTETTYEKLLNEMIEEIKHGYHIDDTVEIDYSRLRQYCIKHEIETPKVIRDAINRPQEFHLVYE